MSRDFSDSDRCKRFIRFCSESGPYTVACGDPAKPDAESINRLTSEDKVDEVLREVLSAHDSGCVDRRSGLLFTLALCFRSTNLKCKQAAHKAVQGVCTSAQDLFMFVDANQRLSSPTTGWGRSLKKIVASWYNSQDPKQLAETVTKYRSRAGWSHKDVLRLSHTKSTNDGIAVILKYIVKGLDVAKEEFGKADCSEQVTEVLQYLEAVDTVKHTSDQQEAARLIEQHKLSVEHVPTVLLKSNEVWTALLQHADFKCVLANVGRLASLGLMNEACDTTQHVIDRLNATAQHGGIQPIDVLVALKTYERSKSWQLNPAVVEVLNSSYYNAFKNVRVLNKRYFIAIQVTSHMLRRSVKGTSSLSPLAAAAAMAMQIARTEKDCVLVTLSSCVAPLNLPTSTKLEEFCEAILQDAKPVPQSAALSTPVSWALEKKIKVDVFLLFTDGREVPSDIKPAQALQQYRSALDIPQAKMITCGLTTSAMKVAEPTDPGMLDIIGFNCSVPLVIQQFASDQL